MTRKVSGQKSPCKNIVQKIWFSYEKCLYNENNQIMNFFTSCDFIIFFLGTFDPSVEPVIKITSKKKMIAATPEKQAVSLLLFNY